MPKGKLSADATLFKLGELFNETLTEKEIENEILDEFSSNYRNRILSSSRSNYDYQE